MSHNHAHARGALSSSDGKVTDSVSSDHLDEVFSLLSNSRRRAAISILLEHENMSRRELVDRVAEVEYGLPIGEISNDERHTIHVSLTQSHLCTLADSEVVERYTDGQGNVRVRLGPRADELARWMNRTDGLGSKIKRSITALC